MISKQRVDNVTVIWTIEIDQDNFAVTDKLILQSKKCRKKSSFVQDIYTRNNIVWKLARGYCLCYCKTSSLVPDSTECTTNFFTEECSTLFVQPKIK